MKRRGFFGTIAAAVVGAKVAPAVAAPKWGPWREHIVDISRHFSGRRNVKQIIADVNFLAEFFPGSVYASPTGQKVFEVRNSSGAPMACVMYKTRVKA